MTLATPNIAIIYVAGPYTDNDPRHSVKQRLIVQRKRYKAHLDYASHRTSAGYVVYSPILMCVPIAQYTGRAPDAPIWMRFVEAFVPRCTEVHVLRLPGWNLSKGLEYELDLARRHDINIHYVPNDCLKCTA